MKRFPLLLAVVLLLGLVGCCAPQEPPQILATTKPVYDLTNHLCKDTALTVGLLIDDNVSCLHDYSLSVEQVRNAQAADVIIISGAGLEDFASDLLSDCSHIIDSSANIPLLECTEAHEHDHDHHHETDAHIWLDPQNAKIMAQNICKDLCQKYPEHAENFNGNLHSLVQKLDALHAYGNETLSSLTCREMVTFHDGFGYFANAFGLSIAAAVEEESGSEASARELIHLIKLMEQRSIPAVFTEANGSASAASIISAEIGIPIYTLNMGMSGDYFEIMYRNIDAVKEALG